MRRGPLLTERPGPVELLRVPIFNEGIVLDRKGNAGISHGKFIYSHRHLDYLRKTTGKRHGMPIIKIDLHELTKQSV